MEETAAGGEVIEIAPGLRAEIVQKGYGRVAEPGDYVEVHYTGWIYDEQAEANRGSKFDSSVDRNDKFIFRLGAGQVIKGWDQGVAGMLIGEKRLLTIAPEMGYGSRGAGEVIPPNATRSSRRQETTAARSTAIHRRRRLLSERASAQ